MPAHTLASGFMVIHGNQPELLRQLLVHWFRTHPLDPLEDEAILVQSNGIAQWLKMALAANASDEANGGCGIAAALDMLLPSRFTWQAYRAVLGKTTVPDTSPFDKPLLTWRLMRLLPELTSQDGYAPLARFLEDDTDLRKHHQLAEKIADLYDQYQVYRADWLDAWAAGQDVLINAKGQVQPLDDDQRWQAMLWRVLLEDTADASHTSRAAVHQRFMQATATMTERPAGLPRRISVFGLSSLPRQSLEVLLAISRFTQVILCVHNPCEHYWANLLSEKDHARRSSGRHARKLDMPEHVPEEDLHLHAHPLLAAWGKQGREYIALLDELDHPDSYKSQFELAGQRIDVFESHGEATLLNQLQDDVRMLRSVADSRDLWPPVDTTTDQSVRFHVVHSTQREIEVLHDQLLAAFNADPTLRPRDIIVMVPDVNAYAPHIEAVFGQLDRDDPRYIPFSIADQAKRHEAPLAFALEFLLGLPESRLAVSDLLDLLDVPTVRNRLGIAPDALPTLRRWIQQTNIRWGLDGAHRAQFIHAQYEQNTWLQGLRRMLLGYAIGSDPTGRTDNDWHDIEPYGEVAGLEAVLAGSLSRLLLQLESLASTFSQPATPTVWRDRLQAMLHDVFLSDTPEDDAMLLQMHSTLLAWHQACDAAGLHNALPLSVVREHWLSQIDKATLAQRFLAGRLTFATLMPMRAIPFRMVCLLGMGDGEFPRSRPPVDFDLMARDMRPGDRSRREDDRYLFLEALLSARDRLHISWIGRSIHDNTERPSSVLVSQLRDHLNAGWTLADGSDDVAAALTVAHKLQPFSPAYFGTDPAHSPLFTYAREWEHDPAAAPAHSTATALPGFVFEAPVSLRDLSGFVKDPSRTFLQQRLRVYYNESDNLASEDHEPFALDGLQQWQLGDELIRVRQDAIDTGADESAVMQRQLLRIRRRGELPLGNMASLLENALGAELDDMFTRYRQARHNWPGQPHNLIFTHQYQANGQDILIQDRLDHLFTGAAHACRIVLDSGKLLNPTGKGKAAYRYHKLLPAWVTHLAMHLHPELAGLHITTTLIGRDAEITLPTLETEQAQACLDKLMSAYVAGLSAAQPVAPKAGFAWLLAGGKPESGTIGDAVHQNPLYKARTAYDNTHRPIGEVHMSPYLQRVFPTFEDLWSGGQFTQLCADVYQPLIDCFDEAPAEAE